MNNKKAIIADGLSSLAHLIDERCSCKAMIEYVPIRKLKG
jgi:hypothetical protein